MKGGRKIVEPGLKESLKERNNTLEDLFTARKLPMQEKIKPKDSKSEDFDISEDGRHLFIERTGVSIHY